MLHASEIVVYDERTEAARHERLITNGQARLEPHHDLEALVRKPGAFPGATALEHARSAGKLPPSTTRGGRRPARHTATATAPGP
ncbi:hypothetical protein ABZT08_31580 [Streptomyces sp. NPDC005526]|uniref:hypothetical protein n=1 Tax=Streptomyces sp. NPDC005526 TaxID=3156885 RepID=UPI0033A02099